ncbi:MAG: 2-polyprenylphenol 6-hydroxylase [Pseudomonadota bacterium]|nr:2-polyprenylphenol 6-hydroxylase [Pseudomonadota bacterium]
MLRSLRNARRLLGIALILTWEYAPLRARRRPGQKLARALERLGPAFIKFGQALSTRSDLIGEQMAEDLGDLRDNLPPFPTAIARATVEAELGAPVEALFTEFSATPVAAASIAQVHRAVTKDGRAVAVKILRPRIEQAFARDLDLFFWIADIMERRLQGFHRLKPLEVVRTFKESVFFELDLRFEAAAANELAENIKRHDTGFRVPAVDWQLTSRRVLVTEWIDGLRMNDVDAIKASGLNVDAILAKAARSLFSQVFRDGFFHADLHPGNLFVDKNGDIVAVDFGIMGRLDWNSRLYIAEILRGFLNEDYRHVAEVHFTAGYVPPDKSIESFTQACMAVARPITDKPQNEISVARLLGQMFAIAAEFEMETQPQLLLLQKTMMVTEGVGRMLNPHLNMWELARPLIEDWASAHFGPMGKLKETAAQGADAVRKLPLMLRYMENALKSLGDPEGVKLHSLTIAEIHARRRFLTRQWLTLGWTALAVITLLALTALLR